MHGTDGARIRVMNQQPNPIRAGRWLLPPGQWVEVPIEFLTEYGGLPKLRVDYSAIADHLQTHTEDGRPLFDFYCPLSAVDGYGRHALDVWRGLNSLDVEARLRSSVFVDPDFLDPTLVQIARDNRHRSAAKVAVAFSVPYDPVLTENDSVTRIAITQFETDHVPQRYIERVNLCHHLICTSGFQPEVWRKSGLKIPISVLTPGIDTTFFSLRERNMDGKFKVLHLGALSPRKNTPAAIRIFQQASQGNPDWRLTIKARGTLEDEVRQLARQDRRIEIQFGDAPSDYILKLYHEHDCLLWPSKGEGVGLPPLEAMSTGMELVCSRNSGMMDYLDDRWAWPIKMRDVISASAEGETFSPRFVYDYGEVGNYWLPSEEDGAKQLERCFNAWLKGKGKGIKAAQYVRQCHTLQHQAQSVLDVVKGYL